MVNITIYIITIIICFLLMFYIFKRIKRKQFENLKVNDEVFVFNEYGDFHPDIIIYIDKEQGVVFTHNSGPFTFQDFYRGNISLPLFCFFW